MGEQPLHPWFLVFITRYKCNIWFCNSPCLTLQPSARLRWESHAWCGSWPPWVMYGGMNHDVCFSKINRNIFDLPFSEINPFNVNGRFVGIQARRAVWWCAQRHRGISAQLGRGLFSNPCAVVTRQDVVHEGRGEADVQGRKGRRQDRGTD